MSLVLYYAPMSTASLSEIVIEELGIPCEKVKLDLRAGDTKKPDFMKINPNAKVPAIVHDGSAIWESAAITMYLGEVFGVDKKLYPAQGPKRGEAMKWVVWSNVTMGDAVARWTRNTMDWVPADQHNAKAAAAGKADMEKCLQILDQSLSGKQFLVGEYTLADTHVHAYTDWLRHMKVDFAPYEHVNTWAARCGSRSAYTKIMGAMGK